MPIPCFVILRVAYQSVSLYINPTSLCLLTQLYINIQYVETLCFRNSSHVSCIMVGTNGSGVNFIITRTLSAIIAGQRDVRAARRFPCDAAAQQACS